MLEFPIIPSKRIATVYLDVLHYPLQCNYSSGNWEYSLICCHYYSPGRVYLPEIFKELFISALLKANNRKTIASSYWMTIQPSTLFLMSSLIRQLAMHSSIKYHKNLQFLPVKLHGRVDIFR